MDPISGRVEMVVDSTYLSGFDMYLNEPRVRLVLSFELYLGGIGLKE